MGTPLALSWVLLAYAAVAVAAGSAFSFSTSIAVTQWSLAQGSGGALGSPAAGARTAGWLLLAFGRRGVVPARRSVRVAIAAVLALAVLGLGAGMPWTSRPATVRCCTAALFNRRLLAVAVAAIALGTLIIRQLTALFQHELEQHASRSRHDLAEAHARLHHIATHDPLTGLPNRNLFKERLAKSFADKRHSGRAIAVAAMDLDRFSTINHSLGHGVGDGVLMEIAHRLEAAVPAPHTLARVGRDSFGLRIDSVTARMEAHSITSAMLAALEQPFLIHGEEIRIHGEEIRVRLSIGVRVCPDDARRGDDLPAHAEAALVACKHHGDGSVVFFDPSSARMHPRARLRSVAGILQLSATTGGGARRAAGRGCRNLLHGDQGRVDPSLPPPRSLTL